MKLFRFETGDDLYTSQGRTLKEAKARLVRYVGCTPDYFDEQTKITELALRVATDMFIPRLGIRITRYEGNNRAECLEVSPHDENKPRADFELIRNLIENHEIAGVKIDSNYLTGLEWSLGIQ